jgi:MFS family permease
VAIQLIAVRLGASPGELAVITFASRLPMLAFGLIAGGLADRLDRRRTMVAIQLLRVAVAAALAALALADQLSLLALAVAGLALGIGEAFFDTNAQALIPMVTGRARLVAANARLAAVETLAGTFVGPPVGGLLVALSIPLALSSAAGGFALALLGLALLTGSFHPGRRASRPSLPREIGEGIAYLVRHRLLATLTAMTASQHLASGPLFALFALYAVAPGPMGLSEPVFGLLLTAFGAGSLAATFFTGVAVGRLGRSAVFRLSTLVLGLGLLVPALTANAVAVGVGWFAIGLGITVFGVVNVSTRQALVPPELLGRVNATHRFTSYLAGIVGAALGGAVGEIVGLREAFAAGAAAALLGLLGGVVVTDARIAEAEAAEARAGG